MGVNGMKKLAAFSILIIFICMSLPSSYSIQIEHSSITLFCDGNTLYVGGNGTGNYSKIQDAIDNASDGDTVFIYDDSSPYNEWDIRINKSINLIGENRYNTIIDGNNKGDRVVLITSKRVNVSGFTITNGFDGILTGCYNHIISDNHFINCDNGITITGGDESYIISNSFSKNCVAIRANRYHSSEKQFVTISNNTIISSTENGYEIADIFCWSGNNYVITNNTLICNYPDGWRRGLVLEDVSDSIIEGNKISGYEFCISLLNSPNNIISHNNITNSDLVGISIIRGSGFTKVKNNNFINNSEDATRFFLSFNNQLDGNYWDEWIGFKYKLPIFQRFPHIIFGFLSFNIDWHPALEPYDI
jgi:parallel beta-helix repeat protein